MTCIQWIYTVLLLSVFLFNLERCFPPLAPPLPQYFFCAKRIRIYNFFFSLSAINLFQLGEFNVITHFFVNTHLSYLSIMFLISYVVSEFCCKDFVHSMNVVEKFCECHKKVCPNIYQWEQRKAHFFHYIIWFFKKLS